jgi:hypothetical protein
VECLAGDPDVDALAEVDRLARVSRSPLWRPQEAKGAGRLCWRPVPPQSMYIYVAHCVKMGHMSHITTKRQSIALGPPEYACRSVDRAGWAPVGSVFPRPLVGGAQADLARRWYRGRRSPGRRGLGC